MFKTFMRRIYLPSVIKGMLITMRRFLFEKRFTLKYPEEKHIPPAGYRGEHYLKQDDQGRMACVACFMCSTACPAECITIVAGESPWPDRDKVPVKFEIDMLKCIYCGYCEEACPCDAIALGPKFPVISTSRQGKIYDMEKLLGNAPDPVSSVSQFKGPRIMPFLRAGVKSSTQPGQAHEHK